MGAPKKKEPQLEAISRLAAILGSSADAMIGKTLDGVITSWNGGAERMYGYRAEEIVGRNVSVLVPSDRSDELPGMLERLARGERIENFETRRLCKDGTIVDVSVSISPVRYGAVIVGAYTVTRDLTERKRAESDLRALQDQLHQAQRLESIGQLAGGIAHDFNNLLAAIMNYAALVSEGLAEITTRLGLDGDDAVATAVADVGEITTVAIRAAQLTHQLLIFSHREAVKPEILDLNTLVVDIEKLLRRTIGEDVDLSIDLAPDLPRTKVDRGQVEQVLMNLAVNARDAMSASGGSLRIATASFEADYDYARQHLIRPGHYVRLTVSDTGSGMPPEVAAWAFEPFFTTKAKGEGSGLGLATVYGIATQAGGDVVLYSEPDLGTTIRVDLPATEEDATSAPEPLADTLRHGSGEVVLLVEDEDIVRIPAGRMLTRYGYTVLAASNAEEALRVAGEHAGEIDLLLTDVVMPGQSGKDLAAELSRLRPATKVLYMSGYSQDVIFHQAMLEEGVDLIEKPFAVRNLLRQIREVLDTR
jgi:PAS domain S-box-containing protein